MLSYHDNDHYNSIQSTETPPNNKTTIVTNSSRYGDKFTNFILTTSQSKSDASPFPGKENLSKLKKKNRKNKGRKGKVKFENTKQEYNKVENDFKVLEI